MGKMGTLEKKLQKLETEIRDITGTAEQRTDTAFGKIEQRLGFLAKLLEAEFASRPDIRDELHRIRERLAVLDAVFRDRNGEDSQSVCSDCCTHMLLHDDVLECAAPISEEEEVDSTAAASGGAAAVAEEDVEVGRRTSAGLEKLFGVFSCGVLVGSIFALKLQSPAGEFAMDASVLPPT